MTMRIIKEGRQPATEWQMECKRCGCIFAFDNKDVQWDQRENDEWVHCPTCNQAIGCKGRKYWGKGIMRGDQ